MLVGCALGVIGCAIVPGSDTIYRMIAGQTIKGFGYATTPLLYAIPSEILPKRWRPSMQGPFPPNSLILELNDYL